MPPVRPFRRGDARSRHLARHLLAGVSLLSFLVAASAAPAAPSGAPFGSGGLWRAPVPGETAIDPQSAPMVRALAQEVAREARAGLGPGLSAAARASVYTVGPDVPLSPVALDAAGPAKQLAQVFARGVPIPARARPASGTDSAMVIYQPSSDTMWEFFQMQQALHFPRTSEAGRAADGGDLSPGSYRYWVSAVNRKGETTVARQPTAAVTLAHPGAAALSWTPIDGAGGYRVYRGADREHARLVDTVDGDTHRYTDDGARPGAAEPPQRNTAVTPGHWRAAFGGRMTQVSSNPGYFHDVLSADGEPLEQYFWGATATSLPLAAGMVTKADIARGSIDHALALGLPNLAPETSLIAAGRWAFPAQRSDGKSTLPTAIPEGARLRLDPALDIDALHLPPFTRMLAEAAQRYGIIVQDGSAATVFYGEDPMPSVRNGEPNFYDQLIGPRQPGFLADFPWSDLQVMKMSLCTVPSRPCVA